MAFNYKASFRKLVKKSTKEFYHKPNITIYGNKNGFIVHENPLHMLSIDICNRQNIFGFGLVYVEGTKVFYYPEKWYSDGGNPIEILYK